MPTTSLWIDDETKAILDELVKAESLDNRSQFIRQLIRQEKARRDGMLTYQVISISTLPRPVDGAEVPVYTVKP